MKTTSTKKEYEKQQVSLTSAKPADAHDKISILVNFGYQIWQQTRLAPLLDLLAEEVRQILTADRCSIFLYDKSKNELWSQVAHGMGKQTLRFPLDHGIIGKVASTMETVNVKDTSSSEYFNPTEDLKSGYHTQTILAMPLKDQKKELVGVFEVLNKKEGVFDQNDEGILAMLCSIAASAIENAQLTESIRKSHLETILRLAMAAEARDQEDLKGHLRRMSRYSAYIAEGMGLPQEEVEAIQYASPLHDIGKIAIPDRVLRKPARLTEEETKEMHEHTVLGAKILENAESHILQIAYNVAYAHHERYDGKGYPRQLAGEDIPLEARIVALADVFDALTSKRVYKPGWSLEETLTYIRSESGKHFDPRVVQAFFKSLPAIKLALESGSFD
jgi:response regulator RpfG family c-di-GMP phosphodiesterase